MAKAKWMAIFAALFVAASGVANAQQGAQKIGYLPSTVGQALTQAWKAGIEKTVKNQPNG